MTVGTKGCICASICVPPRMRSNAVGGRLMYSELGVGWCSYDASTYVTFFETATWHPFVSALKGIKFLFAACKKGLPKMQKNKKHAKIKEYFMLYDSQIPSCSLRKGGSLPLDLLQKVINYPRANCMRILRIVHADNISNTLLREINLTFINGGKFYNSVYHPRFLYP